MLWLLNLYYDRLKSFQLPNLSFLTQSCFHRNTISSKSYLWRLGFAWVKYDPFTQKSNCHFSKKKSNFFLNYIIYWTNNYSLLYLQQLIFNRKLEIFFHFPRNFLWNYNLNFCQSRCTPVIGGFNDPLNYFFSLSFRALTE